jgi:3-hydroxyisobutyrate dehydrogenase-like beta-hydroxyacid dehydrogenase
LLREGAIAAGTPAEAELGADAVVTMLFDDQANEQVIFGPNGLMDAMSPGALHISCSTISVALSERLTAEHARRGHEFVAAPVFGRPEIAEQGKLWVIAAGKEDAVKRAQPVLEAFSRGISVVGDEPRQAHAVKLGGNFLIGAMIYGLCEAFVYSEKQGVPPETFFEAINSALFQSPFYAAYSKVILHPPDTPGASIELGEKDTRLLREAAAARQTKLTLADALAKVYAEAKAAGLSQEDWALGQYRVSQMRSSG